MKEYFVYILLCHDKSYYTGVTNDLDRRLYEHHTGYDPKSYTFSKRPLELVFYEIFNEPNQAIEFEKQVKGWSRKKKQALINNNWEKLKEFAECKNSSNYKIAKNNALM